MANAAKALYERVFTDVSSGAKGVAANLRAASTPVKSPSREMSGSSKNVPRFYVRNCVKTDC
jgi:hypothetical protein